MVLFRLVYDVGFVDCICNMVEQATVLYDFSGLPESGEVSLREGDIVTIRNKAVGDGWWEGATADGRSGLFPESYVQLIPAIEVNSQVCFWY